MHWENGGPKQASWTQNNPLPPEITHTHTHTQTLLHLQTLPLFCTHTHTHTHTEPLAAECFLDPEWRLLFLKLWLCLLISWRVKGTAHRRSWSQRWDVIQQMRFRGDGFLAAGGSASVYVCDWRHDTVALLDFKVLADDWSVQGVQSNNRVEVFVGARPSFFRTEISEFVCPSLMRSCHYIKKQKSGSLLEFIITWGT